MFMELTAIERKSEPDKIKALALDYFKANSETLLRLMSRINPIHLEKTHKLPELTKLMKEIEKLNINDAKLSELKKSFSAEISNCETWKERCIQIRRADKRRTAKMDEKTSNDLAPPAVTN
jgi:hypothetical protein